MGYDDILSNIQEHQKTQEITNQLYRYSGLIQAIEFFSQRFNDQQILEYAYDFVTELLLVSKIAIFGLKEDYYVLVKNKGYEQTEYAIPYTMDYDMIATFHGNIMLSHDLERFFPSDFVAQFPAHLGMPLAIENRLYGFIVMDREEEDNPFIQDDYIIAEALMKLFNTALSNFKGYRDLHEAKTELDEKVFNLFAINQASKVLLSELDLASLHTLSIDVFSELTQSSFTSFFLYDSKSESYILRGMRNTLNPSMQLHLSLRPIPDHRLDLTKYLLDLSKEDHRLYLDKVFFNGMEILSALQPVYVVMLMKNDELLGFVTLGENVTGKPYNKGIFELIESLASSTYIALSNSRYFHQVTMQKKLLQNKFQRMVSLNQLMKNINSARTVESLIELTLTTLEVSFGMTRGVVAFFDEDQELFTVKKSIGIPDCESTFPFVKGMERLKEGQMVFINTQDDVCDMMPYSFMEKVDEYAGVLLVPICLEDALVTLMGVIAVFQYHTTILSDEESMLTVDSIANHIAPVLYHLTQMENQQKMFSPNHEEIFLQDLHRHIHEAEELYMDLTVLHIHTQNTFSFQGNLSVSQLQKQFKNVYPVSPEHIFMSSFYSMDMEKIKAILPDSKITAYVFKKDFHNFEEFSALFA